MNAENIEEAIRDWHRLGHRGAIPCRILRRLHEFFLMFEHEAYVTYHLKTINYFINDALRASYWIMVSTLLGELARTGSNAIIRAIEATIEYKLSPAQSLYYGHVMVAELGAPWSTQKERAEFLCVCEEFPNILLPGITNLLILAFQRGTHKI